MPAPKGMTPQGSERNAEEAKKGVECGRNARKCAYECIKKAQNEQYRWDIF